MYAWGDVSSAEPVRIRISLYLIYLDYLDVNLADGECCLRVVLVRTATLVATGRVSFAE
jgi:hypothetical protein